MYRCEICGAIFDQPFVKKWSDYRPDGFFERFKTALCPCCGEPYFNELEESADE